MLKFYCEWLRRAFARPLLYVDLLAGFLALIGQLINYFFPEVVGTMTVLTWAIPVGIFVASVVIGLLLAPYYMREEINKERNTLKQQLEDKSAKANIALTLSTFHAETHGLIGREITSANELDLLQQDAQNLALKHSKYIHDFISPADAELFIRGVVYPLKKFGGRYDDKHNLLLNKLDRRREVIADLMRRFQQA